MGDHLSYEDRFHIKAQRDAGKTLAEIARKLNADKSTISREMKRNQGRRGYRPKQAHRKARERWQQATKAVRFTRKLRRYIAAKLRADWSPEQITGRLKREGRPYVSHERIYQ